MFLMFKEAGGRGHVVETTPKTASKATLFGVHSSFLQTIEVDTRAMSAPMGETSSAPAKIDRHITTPFHLKLFYRQHSFHHLSDFPIPAPPSPNVPSPPPPALPPHLQIYTWQSCSLRELAQLLTSCLPSLL